MLHLRQDNRINYLVEDRRVHTVAHQGTHQGIPLQRIHRNSKFKMMQRRTAGGSRHSALNPEHHERTIHQTQKRMILWKEEGLPRSQNHLCCGWSRYLHHHLHPLGDIGSVRTTPDLLPQCSVPLILGD